MYNIPELEKKWRKYKRAKLKRVIYISALSILLVAGVATAVNTYLNKKAITPVSIVNSSLNNSNNTNITKNSQPSIIIEKNSLDSNVNALISTQRSNGSIDITKATIVKTNIPDQEIRVIGFSNKDKQELKKKYGDILLPTNATQDINDREHIKELEDNFKDSQDPNDSLEIAKYYYKKGNYKKSEDWAVNTNNIDGDLEDSWLIFAKSRAKQGDRVDAIKVLQSFYDETNSLKAKKLLNKLRHGKSID